MTKAELKDLIVNHYLSSEDFNGLPARAIEAEPSERDRLVTQLVNENAISINFGDRHPNPHIQAFEPEDSATQLSKLEALGLGESCLYPSKHSLAGGVSADLFASAPFSRMLALGEPQLAYRVFDLTVVEPYRNDPRYT